jgi:hypothetical protein
MGNKPTVKLDFNEHWAQNPQTNVPIARAEGNPVWVGFAKFVKDSVRPPPPAPEIPKRPARIPNRSGATPAPIVKSPLAPFLVRD